MPYWFLQISLLGKTVLSQPNCQFLVFLTLVSFLKIHEFLYKIFLSLAHERVKDNPKLFFIFADLWTS